jgi:hypothetical protein
MANSYRTVESACPVCRSRKVRTFKFHGILEGILLRIMRIHPFWCNACDRRFYLFLPASEFCGSESDGEPVIPN